MCARMALSKSIALELDRGRGGLAVSLPTMLQSGQGGLGSM